MTRYLTLVLITACVAPDDESLATATSAVYTATITASPSPVELGQTITASWTSAPEHSPIDYITLARVGSPDTARINVRGVNAAGQSSGEVTFVVPLNAAHDFGPFEVRYFLANSTKIATSDPIVGFADYALTDTPASVELGQPVSVTWHAPLAHAANDYITLAKVGMLDNQRINIQAVADAGLATGSNTFTLPLTAAADPGPYEFRYFHASGQRRATSTSFVGVATYAVHGPVGAVELGQPISVTWEAPRAHATNDYITLAKVGTPDNARLGIQAVGDAGLATGSNTFTLPLTEVLDPGPYEVRYFYASGVRRATSTPFIGFADYAIAQRGSCVTGQPFTVEWTAPLAHNNDIIAIFNSADALVTYRHINNLGLPSGTVTFLGLAAGSYEIRYLFGNRVTDVTALGCLAP